MDNQKDKFMKKLEIATGNFANLKKYLNSGYYPISIAISARYFSGDKYPSLAPKRDFMMEERESYTPKYYGQILDNLDPQKVIEDLRKMSKNQKIVLLCHEKEGDFCHRRLVAKWLSPYIGDVPELGKMNKQKTLF
jgi:uncharacterized protein (DUF488 family)